MFSDVFVHRNTPSIRILPFHPSVSLPVCSHTIRSIAIHSTNPSIHSAALLIAKLQHQPLHFNQNSPSLAIDTWKSLLRALSNSIATLQSVLPTTAYVALIAASAGLAVHFVSVYLPDWRKAIMKSFSGGSNPEGAAQGEIDPSQPNLRLEEEAAESVLALRAQVDKYSVPLFTKSDPSYADLSESHIRSLEFSNMQLRDTVKAMGQEIERRRRHEDSLQTQVASIQKLAESERSDVDALKEQVKELTLERDEEKLRTRRLEADLVELRMLYESLAASRASSRKSSVSSLERSLSSWRMSDNEGSNRSVSRGRALSTPKYPILPDEVKSMSEEKLPQENSNLENESVSDAAFVTLAMDEHDGEWEALFDEREKLKGENVLA